MSSDPSLRGGVTAAAASKSSSNTATAGLKKGFSFKPQKVRDEEEKAKRELEEARQLLEKQEAERVARIEKEVARIREAEEKRNQHQIRKDEKRQRKEKKAEEKRILKSLKATQVPADGKRRAIDFYSDSSSQSSSISESQSESHSDSEIDQEFFKETTREKDKKESRIREESPFGVDKKDKKKKKEKKEKKGAGDGKQKKEKKEKKEKKSKSKKSKDNNKLAKINDEELDLYYDVVNENKPSAAEASAKFLYKHVFHRNCLPISIINFADKGIAQHGNYARAGDVPGYRFIDCAIVLGFKQDEQSMGLFDDLNAEIGRNSSFSRRRQLKQQANIRYFDRKFNSKREGGESSVDGATGDSQNDLIPLRKILKKSNKGSLESAQGEALPAEFIGLDDVYDESNKGALGQNKSNNNGVFESINKLSAQDYSDLKDIRVNLEDLSAEEITLFQQNKEFNAKIKENPDDPFIWIDFIELQEKGIKYSANHQFSISTIEQKKIGIIEKALSNESLKNNQILILYHMRVLQASDSGEDFYRRLNEKWMSYIQANLYNALLWNNFLDFRYSNLLKFSATYFRESTAELLAFLMRKVTSSKQVDEIITFRKIILLVIRKIAFIEEQMGYKERSFGMMQALIEMNVFAPSKIKRILNQQEKLSEFKVYWEDYVNGRTGETLHGGWHNYEENLTKSKEVREKEFRESFIGNGAQGGNTNTMKSILVEMDESNWIRAERSLHEALWRPANPLVDQDLIRYTSDSIVFAEDISQFLLPLNDPESQITLVNILFENFGLPPVNDNIFLSSENRAFSVFYSEKAKNLLVSRAASQGSTATATSSATSNVQHEQYCSADRLDYLNKFFSLTESTLISGSSPARKAKLISQLEYARRLLYEMHAMLDRESILIYLMWIEGVYYLQQLIPPADAIISDKQARKNLRTLLQQNESMQSLWVIYAEISYLKAVTGKTSENNNNNIATAASSVEIQAYAEVDSIYSKILEAATATSASKSKVTTSSNSSFSKSQLIALYFWSSFYLRQAGKKNGAQQSTEIIEKLTMIIAQLDAGDNSQSQSKQQQQQQKETINLKNVILRLRTMLMQQIANEKNKLTKSRIPLVKMKTQHVFPLSKKSILAYFLMLTHALLCDSGRNQQDHGQFSEYFELIEATNEEKIKIWDDAELYMRLQRKFQNEMQLLFLNVLRIQKLQELVESDVHSKSLSGIAVAGQRMTGVESVDRKEDKIQLFKTILNEKYPFFSVALVELILFNMHETTRIDRLVALRDVLEQRGLFYSVWLVVLFNEIQSIPCTEEQEIMLSKLRHYFAEAAKDDRILDKQIELLNKFRNSSVGIDSTTDYFNQIAFLSLYNSFTELFETDKLANRSLYSLQLAPFSKETYLYRLTALEEGEQMKKTREMVFEKEIRIVYSELI